MFIDCESTFPWFVLCASCLLFLSFALNVLLYYDIFDSANILLDRTEIDIYITLLLYNQQPFTMIYLFIYFLFIQCLMRVAQLVINNYSTLWPSEIQNRYVHIYIR